MAASGCLRVWLDVIKEGYCDHVIDNLEEEAKACVCTSLLERTPSKFQACPKHSPLYQSCNSSNGQLAVGLSQSGLSYLYDGDLKWQQHIPAAAGPG